MSASWPFTNSSPFNFDTGLVEVDNPTEAEVPNSPDADFFLVGAHVNNSSGVAVTLTVKDGNGAYLIGPVEIPAGTTLPPLEWVFKPTVAPVTWEASGPGVFAQLWGYK